MKVQRQSRAYLALLGAVAEQSPATAHDEISPVIDVTWLLNQGRALTTSAANAALTQANSVFVTVPSNEYWHVLSVECRCGPGQAAMTGIALSVNVDLDGSASPTGWAWESSNQTVILQDAGANAICRAIWLPLQPIIAGPGTVFYGTLDALIGVANANVAVNVNYYLLPS